MPQTIHAESTAIIDAKPEVVYNLLSDYVNGHPRILPKEYFADLIVEQGGKGAGTVLQVTTKAFGAKIKLRMRVTEAIPGKLLVEEDIDKTFATSFIFEPHDSGNKTELRIATDWQKKPGLKGFIEGLTTPPVARMIYKKELKLIAEHISGK